VHRRILPADRNATRLFLNIGKMDQIRKKNIADLFRDRGRIPARKIRKMELLDKFSFIDVSSDCANKCVKNLNGIRLNGRKLKVEIANGGRQDRGWLSKKQA
ncbi:MAG: DbpA RNA binding domain-containing protein, partial [Lachnospiraceae bacterium]